MYVRRTLLQEALFHFINVPNIALIFKLDFTENMVILMKQRKNIEGRWIDERKSACYYFGYQYY